MVSVVIQPFTYSKIDSLDDIKSITILKCSRKAIFDEDFSYETLCDKEIKNIENLSEIYDIIVKNINNETLITYNSRLLISGLIVLEERVSNLTSGEMKTPDYKKVPDLMVKFANLHNNGKWAKIANALQYYDYNLSVDTNDSHDMAAKTIMLYRLMKDADDL